MRRIHLNIKMYKLQLGIFIVLDRIVDICDDGENTVRSSKGSGADLRVLECQGE